MGQYTAFGGRGLEQLRQVITSDVTDPVEEYTERWKGSVIHCKRRRTGATCRTSIDLGFDLGTFPPCGPTVAGSCRVADAGGSPQVIRLRLLGGVDLRGADGTEATDVLRQPKRLALLTYLAASAPLRFHRRDSLLAMFWPELDDVHARGALRRSLHFLRRHLGEAAVVGRGDELGVDSGALWCDVVAFRQAVSAKAPEDALTLYRGDLLEGFFVASAPEFERWLGEERSVLRSAAAAAARSLCERDQAVAPEAAVAWARRAAQLAPEDESAARLLIGALDRAGDRTAALQAFDDWGARLREEFGLEPSPETVGLVDGIRSRQPVRRPAPAPRRPETPRPNLIAVFPFSVRGREDLSYLSEGMVDILSAKLDGAGEIRAVDPHALLRLVEGHGQRSLDPSEARDIAAQFGAGAYLLGSIVAAERRLHLTATLYETGRDQHARAEVEADQEAGIFETVDELVRQLLARRSTSLGGHIGRLAATTTASIGALKAYLRGERAYRGGRYFEAVTHYERAVDADPRFALGQYRLAAARVACAMAEGAREASVRACEARERLAPHARMLVEAQAAWLGDAPGDAEAVYLRLLSVRPDDVEGWFRLGCLLFDLNPYRGRSALEAKRPLEQAAALDPSHVAALAHLARIAAIERHPDGLRALVERHLALSPTGDQAIPMRGLLAFATGDTDEQERVVHSLGVAPPVIIATTFTDVALYAADLSTVESLARRIARLAPVGLAGVAAPLMVAHVAVARGALDEAWSALQQAEQLEPLIALEHRGLLLSLPFLQPGREMLESTVADLERVDLSGTAMPGSGNLALGVHDPIRRHLHQYLLGQLVARLGDHDRARGHAARCGALPPSSQAGEMPRNLAAGIRARVALETGDWVDVVTQLETVRSAGWFENALVSPIYGLALERYLRGTALVRLGREDEARGWLEGLAQRSPWEIVYREPAAALMAGKPV